MEFKTKGAWYLIIGVLLWIIFLYALTYSSWLWATVKLIQGGITLGLFFLGLGLLILGISELRG